MRRRPHPHRPSRPAHEDGNPRGGPIAASPAIGHNSRAAQPPLLPSGASCARCQHWNAPSERETRDYELFRLGLARRRVKEPSGACDRVLLRWNGYHRGVAATVKRVATAFGDHVLDLAELPSADQLHPRSYSGIAIALQRWPIQ